MRIDFPKSNIQWSVEFGEDPCYCPSIRHTPRRSAMLRPGEVLIRGEFVMPTGESLFQEVRLDRFMPGEAANHMVRQMCSDMTRAAGQRLLGLAA